MYFHFSANFRHKERCIFFLDVFSLFKVTKLSSTFVHRVFYWVSLSNLLSKTICNRVCKSNMTGSSPLKFRFKFVAVTCYQQRSRFIIFDKVVSLYSTYFVWQDFLQSLPTQAACLQLPLGLFGSLTFHQSLCLSQEVGQQDLQSNETGSFR